MMVMMWRLSLWMKTCQQLMMILEPVGKAHGQTMKLWRGQGQLLVATQLTRLIIPFSVPSSSLPSLPLPSCLPPSLPHLSLSSLPPLLLSPSPSLPPSPHREEEAVKLDGLSVSEMKQLRDSAEKFVFQAEVNRMMKLIINSLYRNKEVSI